MLSMGIDIGYSSVKIAITDANGTIRHAAYRLHRGNAGQTLKALLADAREALGKERIEYGAITGSGRKMLGGKGIAGVNEVAALVEGALLLAPNCASVIEIGGQSAKYVTDFSQSDKTGVQVSMNSSCSSGTGSFLEEQASRLSIDIEQYAATASRGTHVPRIAGRCSVFAKTDIIHHQQEGTPVPDILLGLAHAVAKNYRSSVMRGMDKPLPILFAGGVSKNRVLVEALRSVLKLDEKQLVTANHGESATAVGTALLAARHRLPLDMDSLLAALETTAPLPLLAEKGVTLEPLARFGSNDAKNKHHCVQLHGTGLTDCWLGIDVGSTSTNLVLADQENRIIGYRYLRTSGDPVTAVKLGLRELHDQFRDSIRIAGVATTGSGRYMIGRLVGADVVRDEITAQARGALALNPDVDTVMEIGGQDSKFIALNNGVVTDFQMNKICAAGTGSFIEEQAKKLSIDLNDFGEKVFESQNPIPLGERCTVFMETAIAAHLAHGAEVKDLAAGLCYSIVKNYLNRVVGQKPIGKTILFQGGVAHNQGVVNALRAVLGKTVIVPQFFSVSGAFGAAILAREQMQEAKTAFKGFSPQDKTAHINQEQAKTPATESAFNRDVQDFIFDGYEQEPDPNKKTVGMARALFTYGMFPMFYPFFKTLGLNVVLSEPTSEKTIRLAQEYSLDETCYPVKLMNGHAAELVQKNVDYLFFPDLYTVAHPGSQSRQNYGCAYMQLAFKIINKAMRLEEKGIRMLAPTIAFNLGPDFMRPMFMDLGAQLGCTPEQTMQALQKGMESYHAFEQRIGQRAKEAMASLDPTKKTFVLISKIYGMADPALNLGIADRLAEMGYQTLPFFDTPEANIFRDHPNMYWPFGQHILEAARVVRHHPNLHAIFLTHHGCGPDTVLSHYFRDIMEDKPHLTIEVDEHSSAVGVITRVEAFVNSLEANSGNTPETVAGLPESPLVNIMTDPQSLTQEAQLLLPRLYPYSQIFSEQLAASGRDAQILPETDTASIEAGRRHTVANEYFSMAALLGDVQQAVNTMASESRPVLVLPQNEGAEVDGQYARFLRSKLDQQGLGHVELLSPFLEDAPCLPPALATPLQLGLLAGDMVLLAPASVRDEMLQRVVAMVREQTLTLESLCDMANEVRTQRAAPAKGKRLFAIGEPLVLYNSVLNDRLLQRLEEQGHRVTSAPLGENLYHFWNDYTQETEDRRTPEALRFLNELRHAMKILSEHLQEASPYAPDHERLAAAADAQLGHYAGSFGRYRAAKARCCPPDTQGVIAVSSMYENTGISLGILQRGAQNGNGHAPLLSLTFDGNRNENDATRTESFIHYL